MTRSTEPVRPRHTPPREPFTVTSARPAAEDGHVLFERQSAETAPGTAKRFEALLAGHRGPLVMDIHGYTAGEGGPKYSVSLAAQRAASMHRVLLPLLPPGAQIELFSHGESELWGDLALNRRAGVQLWRDVPVGGASGFQLKPIVPPLTLKPFVPTPPAQATPGIDFSYHPESRWIEPDPRQPTYDPFRLPPLQKPPALIDWQAMRGPFVNRGLQLSDRDIQNVQDNWNRTYLWGIGLGLSPDRSASAANMLTAAAYNIQLAKEHPNFWDKIDREDTNLGISKSPMVPIITPETLRFLGKTLFKTELNLTF